MPNFYTFRPADATENIKCWQKALTMNSPTAFVCSRQKLRVLKDKKVYGDVENGGYLLTTRDNATVTLMASGSEVMLALQTACALENDGINANIVSVPCFDLLCEQPKEYIDKILDPNTTIIAIEASSAIEYYKFAKYVIGMDSFGQSAPADELFHKFGFTPPQLKDKIESFLAC
jgi:transketolase